MNAFDSPEAWARILTFLPILACSVLGSALTVTKWWQLRLASVEGERLLEEIRVLLPAAEFAAVQALAHGDHSYAARLVEAALARRGAARERLVEHIEHVGHQLVRPVEYGIGAIGLIATLGPLLGLFGTVVGIVLAFERLAVSRGVVAAHELAGAIGTALYTTVAGLIVGMCALVAHRFLSAMADAVIAGLESVAHELVDLVAPGSER